MVLSDLRLQWRGRGGSFMYWGYRINRNTDNVISIGSQFTPSDLTWKPPDEIKVERKRDPCLLNSRMARIEPKMSQTKLELEIFRKRLLVKPHGWVKRFCRQLCVKKSAKAWFLSGTNSLSVVSNFRNMFLSSPRSLKKNKPEEILEDKNLQKCAQNRRCCVASFYDLEAMVRGTISTLESPPREKSRKHTVLEWYCIDLFLWLLLKWKFPILSPTSDRLQFPAGIVWIQGRGNRWCISHIDHRNVSARISQAACRFIRDLLLPPRREQ